MKSFKIWATAVVALSLCVPALAQGRRGGTGGGGQQGGMGQQNQQGGSQNMQQSGDMGQGTMTHSREMDRTHDRLRTQATDKQRQQFKTCTQTNQQLQQQIRTMTRLQKKQAVTTEQAKLWREQVQTELEAMLQEHTRLMESLNQEQQDAVQNQAQQTDRERERLTQYSKDLEAALDMEEPNADQIRDRAKTMDKSMKKFQEQQRNLAYEAGVSDQV